jgi:uncharacterized membrane protein
MLEQTLFEIVSVALFALTLVHGMRRYNPLRLLIALAITAVLMVAEENAVMMLTNNYAYYEYHLLVGGLPVAIALAWLVVVYLGFQLSVIVKSRLLGALITSSVDLILEPAAYYWGLWVWHVPAPYPTIYYFGAPMGNAIGWLLSTFIGVSILNYSVKKDAENRNSK